MKSIIVALAVFSFVSLKDALSADCSIPVAAWRLFGQNLGDEYSFEYVSTIETNEIGKKTITSVIRNFKTTLPLRANWEKADFPWQSIPVDSCSRRVCETFLKTQRDESAIIEYGTPRTPIKASAYVVGEEERLVGSTTTAERIKTSFLVFPEMQGSAPVAIVVRCSVANGEFMYEVENEDYSDLRVSIPVLTKAWKNAGQTLCGSTSQADIGFFQVGQRSTWTCSLSSAKAVGIKEQMVPINVVDRNFKLKLIGHAACYVPLTITNK